MTYILKKCSELGLASGTARPKTYLASPLIPCVGMVVPELPNSLSIGCLSGTLAISLALIRSHVHFLLLNFYLWVCLCIYVYMHTCVQLPAEARRGYWTTGSLSYRWLWAVWYRCWELYLGPLEEQHVLLKAEVSLQFLCVCFRAKHRGQRHAVISLMLFPRECCLEYRANMWGKDRLSKGDGGNRWCSAGQKISKRKDKWSQTGQRQASHPRACRVGVGKVKPGSKLFWTTNGWASSCFNMIIWFTWALIVGSQAGRCCTCFPQLDSHRLLSNN